MQRFRFRLESVLGWRRVQLELEEAKLQRLFAELHALDAARQRLDAEKAAAERMVLQAPQVEACDLAALESHRRHVAREKSRLAKERGGCERRIAEQRANLTKAERDVKLLEKLKDRRVAEWQTAADKEQEALASELFLAKWGREVTSRT